jgi:hypothetical protein
MELDKDILSDINVSDSEYEKNMIPVNNEKEFIDNYMKEKDFFEDSFYDFLEFINES